MTGPRVLFVCQWYPPEPVSQPTWIVRALQRCGAEVEVLTGVPNYPTGKVMRGYSPLRTRTDEIEGVRVRRTPLFPSHDGSSVRRFLNYSSWAFSSALLGRRHFKSADVALVYSSPATAALPAMVARRIFGTPYVLLIQDVWPDSILSSGFLTGRLGRIARRLVAAFASRAYAMASQIVVTSPGMSQLLESRGVPGDKIRLAYNWVEPVHPAKGDAAAALRNKLGLGADDFVVMYAGNHGAAQGLAIVLDAFATMTPEDRCHLVLVGDGMEKASLEALAAHSRTDRVHFVAPQPRDRMADVMSAADVQLVSLTDTPLFAVTTPSKLQSVLAAGQPVLVSANGDAANIVREARAGAAVLPGDKTELVAAVLRLRALSATDRAAMGRSGRAFYEAHMSEAVGAQRLLDALHFAAADAGSSRRVVRSRIGR